MNVPTLADVVISEAARRYVAAFHRLEDAFGYGVVEVEIAYDDALHDLVVAVDAVCEFCDPGFCDREEVDVVDSKGRL